ncbi:hypothetical protein ABPG77_005017 [Micractinium sp. CCAP 211/92]
MQAAATRMSKELRMLQSDPPPGVWAAPVGDSFSQLEAQVQGPKDTVYEGGLFKLAVDIPARYPFEPPKVKFVTPIYHPNIDAEGRICLDILNMPPKGAWKPSLNVPTVLASIGLLLAEPNPEDGLVTDVTAEYKHQRQVFDAKARQWTQRHAMHQGGAGAAADDRAGADAQHREQQQEQAAADEGGKENGQPDLRGSAGGKQHQLPAGAEAALGAAAEARQEAKRPRLALRK